MSIKQRRAVSPFFQLCFHLTILTDIVPIPFLSTVERNVVPNSSRRKKIVSRRLRRLQASAGRPSHRPKSPRRSAPSPIASLIPILSLPSPPRRTRTRSVRRLALILMVEEVGGRRRRTPARSLVLLRRPRAALPPLPRRSLPQAYWIFFPLPRRRRIPPRRRRRLLPRPRRRRRNRGNLAARCLRNPRVAAARVAVPAARNARRLIMGLAGISSRGEELRWGEKESTRGI